MVHAFDAQKQIEFFKAAFESSYDGIHILDSEGFTLHMNEACTRIEGVTIDDIAGRPISELVACGIYSESVTLKVLEQKKTVTIVQKAKNGTDILVTGTPIFKDGAIEAIVVNSRDITDLNSLKQEISDKTELAERYQQELEFLLHEHGYEKIIIARSAAMQKVVKLAMMVGKVDSNILISGESGVGKGVLSRNIHERSARKNQTFVKIDCGAIPENLFESELFGYEKGAFTGAVKAKAGLLEHANGGTVFFDEIGEIPLNLQSKLLRCLQEREIVRLGGKNVIPLDIRVIAATNRNLEEMIKRKEFREDLFYRLCVVPITIPPLREREDDILPLIMNAIRTVNIRYGWKKKFSGKLLKLLLLYGWPGNVRELENLVERIMVTAESSIIDERELPDVILRNHEKMTPKLGEADYRGKLAAYDHSLLVAAITQYGSIPEAANRLGMNITTLRRKLSRYKEK